MHFLKKSAHITAVYIGRTTLFTPCNMVPIIVNLEVLNLVDRVHVLKCALLHQGVHSRRALRDGCMRPTKFSIKLVDEVLNLVSVPNLIRVQL
eukprot:SAG31_NODE_299_length_18114_cov_3.533777_8_plen_93_part_00